MSDNQLSDFDKEIAKFLDRDFTQSFAQMRHYDGQITDICKFAFTAYTAIIGAALALFKYGVDTKVDYRLPSVAVLFVGLLFGVCMLALVIRNRVYFVFATRHVNEHRGFFLNRKPLGFANQVGMYTDFRQPPFFNWRSSQALFTYTLALLNSFLLGAALFVLASPLQRWVYCGVVAVAMFSVQLAVAITYLITRENKTASKAVFGKE